MSYLTLGSVYIVLYAAAGLLFRGHPFAESVYGNIGLLLPALAVCVVIAWRRREWFGAQRLFWDAFLVGMILWVTGHVGWAFSDLVRRREQWVEWHTMFSLCGGIGPLVAVLAQPHRGRRDRDSGAIAVALVSYAMLGGFIYAYFVLVPRDVSGWPVPELERAMFALINVHRTLMVVGVGVLVWMGRRSDWRATYLKLLIGVFAGFFLRIAASDAILGGVYHSGSFFDLAWIVPFLCYAWAAAEAPRSPRQEYSTGAAAQGPSALLLVIPVLLVPAIGYSVVRVWPLGDPGDSFRILLTTLTTVAGLGLLTLRLSVQSGELQRTDARLRLLAAAVEQTEDFIIITNGAAELVQVNAAAIRELGYSRAELRTMGLSGLVERGFEDTIDNIGATVRKTGVWRGTLVHRRKDGTTFPAANTVVALKDDAGQITHFVGVGRDITQELQLRDQLVNTERLSAIGELVAGVAHELNNPLQTIIGSVELLMDGDAADPSKDLELVRREATRAGQIVRNLLAFVRRSTPDRRPEDLNQIVRATAAVREHHLAQRNIALELQLDPQPVVALVNREEIQQIVLNLVLNAEHAIGDAPGAIRIRTKAGESRHALSVTDTGPGVKPELRGRIFEPFFTTKDVGQGTGLGLSISMGIATAHGGTLELCPPDSADRGACFKLSLPIYEASTHAGTPPQAVAAAFKLK